MPRRAVGLSAAKVKNITEPGRYADGGNLYLYVRSGTTQRFWLFRYMIDGRAREMGLGPAAGKYPVSLAQARDKARQIHDQLRAGIDPLDAKDAKRAARKAEQAKAALKHTFKECSDQYIAEHEKAWSSSHRESWAGTLRDHVHPMIGHLPVDAIEVGHVIPLLKSIWGVMPETASRVRGRIETILDFASSHGWRTSENPARWARLRFVLPKKSKIKPIEHHPALAWADLPAAMAKLLDQTTVAARALRFLVLTAARSGEVRYATWGEVDSKNKLWVIPASRMKARKEHRVPLSDAALAILAAIMPEKPTPDALVFQGARHGSPVSDVAMTRALVAATGGDCAVHGLRSTFRDWCGEATNYPREVAEAALAHAVGNAVEASYARSDLLAKRAKLMDAWGSFATTPYAASVEGSNVLPMHGKATA